MGPSAGSGPVSCGQAMEHSWMQRAGGCEVTRSAASANSDWSDALREARQDVDIEESATSSATLSSWSEPPSSSPWLSCFASLWSQGAINIRRGFYHAAGSGGEGDGGDDSNEAQIARRSRLAQAAECSSVGVQAHTEAVQSEVACMRHWFSRRHELYLHRDCLRALIEHQTSKIVLLPSKALASFPECQAGEVPVAVRVPKDDTQAKDEDKKKDGTAKTLKFPKYGHYRAMMNWSIGCGAVFEVQGVCLGYRLCGTVQWPVGCAPTTAEENGSCGDPEPLEMLTTQDIDAASGLALLEGEFLQVRLKEARSATWKMGQLLMRTAFEIASVYVFMCFLGSEPNYHTPQISKPWDTISNDAFHWPAPFSLPESWRAPGFERIWNLYAFTLFLFLLVRLGMIAIWSAMPSYGKLWKFTRYVVAALYPLAVATPFNLYLLYYFGAISNCTQCAKWHCGVYAKKDVPRIDAPAFMAAGGCNITDERMLDRYRQYVHVDASELPERPQCTSLNNHVLDMLGISLDTTKREGTCTPPWEVLRHWRQPLREAIAMEIDEICGPGSFTRIRPPVVEITDRDRQALPWFMFAWNLPVRQGNCSVDGVGFEHGRYIYYDPAIRTPEKSLRAGAICVCHSARGTRDCFRYVEGTVDRCAHFNGRPVRYGSYLEFEGELHTRLLDWYTVVVIPVYALFTVFAWDDLPLGGQDKSDLRMQSRMRLDILDSFLFYAGLLRFESRQKHAPALKFIFPDLALQDLGSYVWCAAWVSTYMWMSLVILLRVFDHDPDKTPKKWKSVKDILEVAEQSACTLEIGSRASDLCITAIRKQSVLYEKEVQKSIKRRAVVDILEDMEHATFRGWRRRVIVFSSPKTKELESRDYDHEQQVFTLYVAGAWPWSRRPPQDVWWAETWEEYVAHTGIEVKPENLGLTKVSLTYDEALTRVRPRTGYCFMDPRVLGWCHACGRQPGFELKKLKEDDDRIPDAERVQGFSATYYNRYRFDWFERNIEFLGAMRCLCIDFLFLFARCSNAIWGGGFGSMMECMLLLKNFMLGLWGIAYLFSCGNSKHRCGAFDHSLLDLVAKCIERTKVGRAIKLSMLMPLGVLIECLSCSARVSTEERQDYCSKRLHMLLLRRAKASPDCKALKDLDHEIRLLASRIQELADSLELLDMKDVVHMKANMRAKDMVG